MSQSVPDAGRQLTMFTRQLSVLLASGVPLVAALDIFMRQAEEPRFQRVLQGVCQILCEGRPLSVAMGRWPGVFGPIYVSLVRIGERTGALEASLSSLAQMLERDAAVVRRVRSALTYPAFIVSFAGLLTLAVFYTVLPNFVGIFAGLSLPLPLVTRVVILAVDAVRTPGFWLLAAGALALGQASLKDVWSRPEGRCQLFAVVLAVPVVGTMLRLATLTRYCGALSTSLECGLDPVQSLRLAGPASGSPILEAEAEAAVDDLCQGRLLSEHMLGRPQVYPKLLAHIVQAGEEAGKLPLSLRRLATWYDCELSYQVDVLSSALEPILLGAVALLVGTVVIAVFLPLYTYIGSLS